MNNEIYHCMNCNCEIVLTENKSDYYKRKMLKEKKQIFCSNKCSIQYNQLQKFYNRYNPIIEDIKYLYEQTAQPVNKIISKYNISQATWYKIIDRYKLVRPITLKEEMYKNKSKAQIENMTDEQKLLWKNKLSTSGSNYWGNLDFEERKIRNDKNSFKSKPINQQCEILAKAFNTKLKNESFGKSKIEDNLYEKLVEVFGIENVIRQYCVGGYIYDFKITRLSTNPKHKGLMVEQLIELNGSYYHNYRPYIDCEEHLCEYNDMLSQGGQKENIANKWRFTDINKFNYCKNNNLNLIVIYYDDNPKQVYYTDEQLRYSFEKIKKQKLGYTNISKYNEIVDTFDFKELYKSIIPKLKDDDFLNYIVNRIKYVNNYGEGCYIISTLRLLKDFNKYKSILSTYTMHPISNIKTFITNYNIKSIGDPFAGWGHRLVGAMSLDCDYFGCDINEFQTNNLKQIMQFCKNQNSTSNVQIITNDSLNVDVSNFKYTAIFTCPPYWNTEIYTKFGIENMDYESYKQKLVKILKHWITPNVSILGIQFTDKYEDCINALGFQYTKILLNQGKHHLTKHNKKYNEYIYIIKIKE